ncbi:MAG: hypothetical protein ACO1OB_30865 [Archangium sp.]
MANELAELRRLVESNARRGLTYDEAAKVMGVPVRKLRQWSRIGALLTYEAGGRELVSRAEVEHAGSAARERLALLDAAEQRTIANRCG